MKSLIAPGSFLYEIHIIFGMFTFFIGPLQFIPYLRTHFLKLHRLLGKAYFFSVLIAGTTGFAISFHTPLAWAAAGTAVQCILWLLFTGLAFMRIMKKDIASHRRWMLRSYMLVLAAPFLRLSIAALENFTTIDYMAHFELLYPLLVWVSFLPLLIAEGCIRIRQP